MQLDPMNPSFDANNGKLALERRLRVARGQEPGDLLLTGGQVVNVFTERVEPANVVIADGWIAGVGPYEWRAQHTIAAAGKAIVPGFIDCHAHLESTLLTPAERSLDRRTGPALISTVRSAGWASPADIGCWRPARAALEPFSWPVVVPATHWELPAW
jgi:imidazolonepropionase-like amidohydrolase